MFVSGELFQSKCKWNIDCRYSIRKWKLIFNIKQGDTVFMKVVDIPAFLNSVTPYVSMEMIIHN